MRTGWSRGDGNPPAPSCCDCDDVPVDLIDGRPPRDDGVRFCDYPSGMAWTAARLRELLDRLGWTQRQLADHVAVSPRTVSAWLAGASPQRRYLRALDELEVGDTDDGPYDPPLSRASAAEFAAELVRRLTEAEEIRAQARVRIGTPPPGLADRPGIIRGPATRARPSQADSTQ